MTTDSEAWSSIINWSHVEHSGDPYIGRGLPSISSTSAASIVTAPASLASMTVRADPRSSLTALICAVLFLAWMCHIGRSQMDQKFDDDVPRAVCKDPVVNSSIPMPNGDIGK